VNVDDKLGEISVGAGVCGDDELAGDLGIRSVGAGGPGLCSGLCVGMLRLTRLVPCRGKTVANWIDNETATSEQEHSYLGWLSSTRNSTRQLRTDSPLYLRLLSRRGTMLMSALIRWWMKFLFIEGLVM